MAESRTGRLTVDQLQEHIDLAVDELRGLVSNTAYPEVIGSLLLLKRASDQPGLLLVPDDARWPRVTAHSNALGEALDRALSAFHASNPADVPDLSETVRFDRVPGVRSLHRLVGHLDQLPLGDEDLEFPDGLGLAYDRFLADFSTAAGPSGGEFFTPRAVCRLMVELAAPQEGQSVSDPCAGTGGMLLEAAQYVAEHTGRDSSLALYGQEINSSVWRTGQLDLLLHGIRNATVTHGDSLVGPLPTTDDPARFDRVLMAPPLSVKYSQQEVTHPERVRYGWAPESKADLMFVQLALAALRPQGVGAVVTPHGVLFRGGAEAGIRRGIVLDGRLDAVIGIGPNVFYNTGIPACILVLRGRGTSPAEGPDNVLFINAEREVTKGRTKNRMEAQHVAKIVDAYRRRQDLPGFSRVVSVGELAAHDFNLNIRRYVDTAPPAAPLLDISAALVGGVPRAEVEAHAHAFDVFAINAESLFDPGRPGYLDFLPEGYEATAARIPVLAKPREESFLLDVQRWWQRQTPLVTKLADGNHSLTSRLHDQLEDSLHAALVSADLLDRQQVIGVVASWWSMHWDDLRRLTADGFQGVLDRWQTRPGRVSLSRRGQPWAGEGDEAHDADELGSLQELVLHTFGLSFQRLVKDVVAAERQKMVDTYLSWGERYGTPLADLEQRYQNASARLQERLRGLGHV
ncbi:N-6 DNA methylase [Streptomyces sp. NPDC005263]|uniref:N-6 DNA methylase n=1 Tax=Streptomyces sp. NPDC005263 TaxID=3364711 RepID=UPI00368536EB